MIKHNLKHHVPHDEPEGHATFHINMHLKKKNGYSNYWHFYYLHDLELRDYSPSICWCHSVI